MPKQTTWKQVTENRYWEMLGVVPPAMYIRMGFLVGEPMSHRICTVSGKEAETFTAFIENRDGFYECTEALTAAEFKAVKPLELTIVQEAQMKRNRFEAALFIQAGACNGRAVAKALVEAYEAAYLEHQGTDKTNADPAVQFILHQLCHLAKMNVDDGFLERSPAIFNYERATQECVDRCENPEALVTLGLTRLVRPKPAEMDAASAAPAAEQVTQTV